MSFAITKEDYLRAITEAQVIVLSRPETLAMIGEAAAESLARSLELLPAEAAAALLGKAESTLAKRHRAWGLDKSVAFGRETPLYLLSQILAVAKSKVVAGRKPEAASGLMIHRSKAA